MDSNESSNLYANMDTEEEIVISGIAGRFPDCDNIKQLEQNLFNKVDLGSNNHGCWNYHYDMPLRSGKINNIEKFDAQFFDIPVVQANIMEPETRMMLEHTYEAIVDAGINPKELWGTNTAVFTAVCYLDTSLYHISYESKVNGMPFLGFSKSLLANKISHSLGITGPSYNIDTACSSSAFAMMEAYKNLRSGQCDAAIVAASNLCIHPYVTQQLYSLGVLSPDGCTKPFDNESNGYMRSDAVAVIYMQKAKAAKRIYAFFVHAKTNCDGFKEEGIMCPSSDKQKMLMDEFYKECGILPTDLSYLEAHATATIVGDIIETNAIDLALCAKRNSPLLIGSIKSNLGHTESVSALCQIAKILIAMETGVIPPTIHLKNVRKEISAIHKGRIKVVTESTKWEGGYAGINSFGFGGANCHILLKSNPKVKVNNGTPNDELPRLVGVSGRSEEAVQTILNDIHDRPLDVEYVSLLHSIHSDNIEGHFYRGYTIIRMKLFDNVTNVIECRSNIQKSICFVFSGLGTQWLNTCQALMKFSVFAKTLHKCDAVLKSYGISIINIVTCEDKKIFDNIINIFVGLAAVQIGMIDLLTSIGIVPDFIIGHSIGELICGYANKYLTVDETILLAYYTGLAFLESNIINGSMAEINLDFETIKSILPSDIDIVCYNNMRNVIVSGPINSVKAFLVKQQTDNVSVKEISCGNIPLHSRYVEPARAKLLKYFNRILPRKRTDFSDWLSKSVHESAKLPEYYTNYLLTPVLFSKTTRSLPSDTVIIEISPQDILQDVFRDFTGTYIPLYRRSDEDDVEIFLRGIGELYNAGLQPQIANLYRKVNFPVSRGTPMFSHLVRWNHTDDYFKMSYIDSLKLDEEETVIIIDVNNKTFKYMTAYHINGKNVLPPTGYLLLLWQIMGQVRWKKYTQVPVVFEDVDFLRATVLSPQNSIDLTLTIQKGNNRFVITEGDNVVVTGIARVPDDIEHEKISTNILPKNDEDEEEMNAKDIYKELSLRGYQYTDVFRGLKSASITARQGHISWTNNWAAFMDNMLQMKILGQPSRNLYLPTRIRKVVIDPEFHTEQIQDVPIEERQFHVRNYESLDAIISGGIEIHGLVTTIVLRQQALSDVVLEEHKFVAHRDMDTVSLEDGIRMAVHIAHECHNEINAKFIEFVEDSDQITSEDLNASLVNKIVNNMQLLKSQIKVVTTHKHLQNVALPDNISMIQFNKLSKNENCLMVIAFGILTKNKTALLEQLLSLMMPAGFLLTLEDASTAYDCSNLNKYNLFIILEKRVNGKTLVLLRKVQRAAARKHEIVHVNNYEFSWIDKIKSIMDNMDYKSHENNRIIIVAEGDFRCGILGLVASLRKEPSAAMIRCVFIQDVKAPAFSLQELLYSKQLEMDLVINVLRPGNIWGSYRYFPLSLLTPKLVENAYVTQTVRGDLNTLRWVQDKLSPCDKHKDVINIIYASINFRDIMLVTDRLIAETIMQPDNNSFIGMEFVGFNTAGQRIMGLCPNGNITNFQVTDTYLSWIIPDKWTMEEAATIPCVYSTSYYALYLRGKMKRSDKVLIHCGTGGVGLAAIHLALYEGCEVFTTAGTIEKRRFIRETFPSIPEDHIGSSRDTSFEQMIMQQTKGRGVDIVLNSLSEEKLQASVRCLTKGGRFLEIGKFDMISNNPLEMSIFLKGICFYGIMLDKLFFSKSKEKIILHEKIIEGIKNGAIKPLCRKVFEKDNIENAFKYMTTEKHIGKIIIRIRKEDELTTVPILAYPRYYCLENKSYIILGGLGGFGVELADWLISRGARNLILTSRTGIRNAYQKSRVKLWQSRGVNVQTVIVKDDLNRQDCVSILKSAEKQGPVDAIFNLALVLKDNIFTNQSPQAFEDSFKSKAWATKMMDEISRVVCLQLRHFVVFSSVVCGRGIMGQTNYGMANSVMERICERRVENGLHGLAIQWGPFADVGILADIRKDDKKLVAEGYLQQDISSCLDKIETFLLQNHPIVSSLIIDEKSRNTDKSKNILETVKRIMDLNNTDMIPQNVSLANLGMDSIIMVEIIHTLERKFDISLTVQNVLNLNFAKLREIIDKSEQEKIVCNIETNKTKVE